MAREVLTVNGLDLMAGDYRDATDFVRYVPAPVGEDPPVAGRTGGVFRSKVHGPGRFTVDEWVGHPTETRAQVQARWDALLRMTARPRVLSPVVWTLSDGTTRTCSAYLSGEVSPTRIGQRGWRAQLEFTIPDTYWWGADGNAAGAAGVCTLTWQAVSSAPLEHLTYTLAGPFSSATVTSPSTGDTFTYAGTVGSGQSVTVNSGLWTISGSGVTPDPRLLTYSGDRFLTVLVGVSAPTVTYSGAAGLTVAGKTAFL
jgi:hypothetical protein